MTTADDPPSRRLTAEQIVDLRYVAEVAIAPGGHAGAYTVSRMAGPPAEGRTTDLWSVDGDRVTWRFGPGAAASSPAFSPDGALLTFLGTDSAGRSQIFAMPVSGAAPPLALTAFGADITGYAWAPDGRKLAFTAQDPAEVAREARDASRGRDWQVPDARDSFVRLWIFDLERRTAQRVYDAALGAGTFTWTPDARRLVFQGAHVENANAFDVLSQIYCVELPDGEARATPRELRIWIDRDGHLALRRGHLGALLVDPSGRHLAFLSAAWPKAPDDGDLFVVDLAQALEPAGAIAAFRTDHAAFTACDVLAWVGDRSLVFMALEGLQSVLYLTSAEATSYRDPRRLAWPEDHIITAMAFDAERQQLLIAASTPRHAGELYRTSLAALDAAPAEPRRLTFSNPWLRDVALPVKRPIAYPSGALEIQGVLILPADHDPAVRYPLIVAPHGGPMSVWSMGWLDAIEYPVSMLAQDGYIILLPNYRGSAGRGSAFARIIQDHVGVYDIDDLLAGVAYLVERGLVDPERVGILGHSYGGYLADWAATAHSDHFRAAVGISGITDWMSFIGTTDIPSSFSRELWGGFWFRRDEAHLYWQRSPLRYVEASRTPLLMLHGEADTRVPTTQSVELFTSLRAAGRRRADLELVLYPGEPHHISTRAHELDVIRRVIAWFARHLPLGDGAAGPAARRR